MSKRKLNGKALVIQLGWYETHFVLVDKHAQIQFGISVPTPAGAVEDGVIRDEEAVRQMLKEALATPEFKRVRQAVFCLVTSQVIQETATTPDLPANKLEKLIQANMDMYFPVDVQDCHVVWQSIGAKVTDGVKEQEVQLWAVPNAILAPYYTVANDCGLSVAAIDYCGNSIASAVGATYSAAVAPRERQKLSLDMELSFGKKKEPVEPVVERPQFEEQTVPHTDLHITMEKELLGMTFVQSGRVVLQRFIQCGPNPIYQIGEIAMMVEYFQAMDLGRGSKLRGILSGALAEETALIAELSDVLDISLSTFPVTYDTSWFLCAGAALTTMDFGIPALNRPGKARREFQSQIWQYGLILAGGLAILAVVMLTMTSRLGWDTEIRALESEKQVLTIRSAQSAGFADNYYAYENAYNSYSGDWDTIFGSLQTYNNNLVLVMEEMEDLMPENASVVGMQIGSTGLNVTFAAETKEEAAYLMMALRDMQYADLAGISSLQGGGAGPATSYGSGKEAAPSEGSSTTRKTWNELTNAEKQKIYQPIIDDVTKWELAYYFGMGKGETDNMAALQDAISMTPSEVKDGIDLTQYTRQEREAAFSAMITTNPFVLMAAESKLLAQSGSGLEALNDPIVQHVNECCDGNLMDIKVHSNLKDFQQDVEELLEALLWNQCEKGCDALAMTEELILEDPDMTDWYAYYLYHNQGKDLETMATPSCISTDKIIYAVVDSPAAEPVGKILYEKCLSDTTRALIEEVTKVETPPDNTTEPDNTTSPDETTEPATDPDAEKDAALRAKLPSLMTEYLETGKLESIGTTERIDYSQYLEITSLETYLEEQHTKYKNGTLEDGEMKAAIKAYYDSLPPETSEDPTTDTSKDPTTDTSKDPTTDTSKDPTTDTSKDPTTEPDAEPTTKPTEGVSTEITALEVIVELCLPDYIKTGKINISALKPVLEAAGIKVDEKQIKMAEDMLEAYFSDGDSGDQSANDILDKYISSQKADGALKSVLADKNAVDPVKTMLDNYSNGGTGNDALDTWIQRCQSGLEKYILERALYRYLQDAKKDPPENYKETDYDNGLIIEKYITGQEIDPQKKAWLEGYVASKEVDDFLFTLRTRYPTATDKLTDPIKNMWENFLKKGTTGNDELDKRLVIINEAYYKWVLAQTGGNSGGGGSNPEQQEEPDTRYFFAVSLMYKQELLEAELERKGLDNDAKVEKLEVE